MYEFDELESYSAAAVVIDGTWRYEVRHYGGGMVHRFHGPAEPDHDDNGRPFLRVFEYEQGPAQVFAEGMNGQSYGVPVPADQLRPVVLEWAFGDGMEPWRETLGSGPVDRAAEILAEWCATASAASYDVRDEAERVVSNAFDEGDGPSLSTADERGAWSVLWNLSGRQCGHCGAHPDDTPYPETVLLFRDPLYVFGPLPLCADCAETRATEYGTAGDGPTDGEQ